MSECDTNKITPPNPVHEHPDTTWRFYDEVWADEYGPYENELECRLALAEYCQKVLG
jgi:hypothetical protein